MLGQPAALGGVAEARGASGEDACGVALGLEVRRRGLELRGRGLELSEWGLELSGRGLELLLRTTHRRSRGGALCAGGGAAVGEPVVLVHGWPLSGRSWEGQVHALVDGGYRVITYDRRGFGASSQPWGDYDYETMTSDLDALMRHLDLAAQASPKATHDCVAAFGRTDFRADLAKIDVHALIIHGDADAIVPVEISGRRTAAAISGSELVIIEGGPHGINVSHAAQFNEALLAFLR